MHKESHVFQTPDTFLLNTFKVHGSVSVVVRFFHDGVYLSPAHVLAHQLGHGEPQFFCCDLSIAIYVKLTRETEEQLTKLYQYVFEVLKLQDGGAPSHSPP